MTLAVHSRKQLLIVESQQALVTANVPLMPGMVMPIFASVNVPIICCTLMMQACQPWRTASTIFPCPIKLQFWHTMPPNFTGSSTLTCIIVILIIKSTAHWVGCSSTCTVRPWSLSTKMPKANQLFIVKKGLLARTINNG